MASNEQRDLEAVSQLVRATTDNILRLEKASQGIAKNFSQLALQVKSQQRSMFDYVAAAIKLPRQFQEASHVLVTPMEEMRTQLKTYQDQLAAGKSQITAWRDQIARAGGVATTNQQIALAMQRRANRESALAIDLLEKRIKLKKQISSWSGQELAVEFLILKGFADAIRRSGELNQSLIEGNSNIAERNKLANQTWQVMAATGNEQRDMMAAAKALVGVGFDLRKGYKDALMVMVQMEEGLGVSYENSAQLARIFEINLRTPVREVADKIAAIANQTSLAADEATRFATEIGKALRLLGPGAIQGSSAQVVGYMTMMSARMKDVGGDASEVVKAFQTLTKGTAEGFMLRGMAGVNRPGAMGTEAGSKAAMSGIDRMINQIVRSQPGTMAYTAELEIASQVLGISTESVRLWGEMMRKAGEPLSENQKLQQRWQEQVSNANKVLGRIKESTIALLQQAFNPMLYWITKALEQVAKFVSFLAGNQTAVYITMGLLIAGITKAIWSLGQLAITLTQVAASSLAAARSERLRQAMQLELPLGGRGGRGGRGGVTTVLGLADIGQQLRTAFPTFIRMGSRAGGYLSSAAGWLGRIGTTYLPTFSAWFGRIGSLLGGLGGRLGGFAMQLGRLLLSPQGLLVAGAAAAGWAVGRYIDKKWPDNWIAQAARATGEWYAKVFDKANVKTAQLNKFQGDLTWGQLAAQMRQMVYQGRESDVEKHFMAQVHRIKGFESELGGRTLLQVYKQTMAEAREKIGLASVTSAEEEVKNRDLKLIDLTRQGIENTGGSKKLLERAQEDRRAKLAEEKAQRDLAEKQRQTGQRIAPDPHAPTKPRYAIPGKLQ